MQIVINISNRTYDYILKKHNIVNGDRLEVTDAICDGIPLPPGHGRLIDADALKKDDEVTEWLSLDAVRTGKMLKRFSELFIKKIDATPTIIEADRSERG